MSIQLKNILFVSDLDGTLLTTSQKISAENVEAIRRFEEQGGLFTLATGRTEQAVAKFVEELNITTPMILYNGAKIYCPVTQKVIYEKTMNIPVSFWQYIFSKLSEDLALLIYRDGQVYSPHRSALLESHEQKDGVVSLDFPLDTLEQFVTKLLLIANDPAELLAIEETIHATGLEAELVYSEYNYLEILPIHTSKGNTLRILLQLLPHKDLRTIAVGDQLNDLTIIQQADDGYAVENAHPTLKIHANNVTVHHEEHAIADIIEKLMKLEV
ncbi:HAD family hydrolase [Paenibacillus sp. GCM10028914]|uniref:HAD family hydrolase n=1 Tax=Paenibacillus sp. GCM10028914 TaxID=3273416 RepID=UPI003615E803